MENCTWCSLYAVMVKSSERTDEKRGHFFSFALMLLIHYTLCTLHSVLRKTFLTLEKVLI